MTWVQVAGNVEVGINQAADKVAYAEFLRKKARGEIRAPRTGNKKKRSRYQDSDVESEGPAEAEPEEESKEPPIKKSQQDKGLCVCFCFAYLSSNAA